MTTRAGFSPETRYQEITKSLRGRPGVTLGSSDARSNRGFGSNALRIDDKIFAMLDSRGRFVVKLPRDRVGSLIVAGDGEPFESGRGRVMREWVVLSASSDIDWLDAATEAMRFVGKEP